MVCDQILSAAVKFLTKDRYDCDLVKIHKDFILVRDNSDDSMRLVHVSETKGSFADSVEISREEFEDTLIVQFADYLVGFEGTVHFDELVFRVVAGNSALIRYHLDCMQRV